jgi:hypothetical protein
VDAAGHRLSNDGNEQIIDILDGSMLHLRFWESSHRGGLHI